MAEKLRQAALSGTLLLVLPLLCLYPSAPRLDICC